MYTEKNSRIFVRDECKLWAMKGRFNRAVKLDEEIPWLGTNDAYISILAVCFCI